MSVPKTKAMFPQWQMRSKISPVIVLDSVTRRKSPNVYKSCPKMISLEK